MADRLLIISCVMIQREHRIVCQFLVQQADGFQRDPCSAPVWRAPGEGWVVPEGKHLELRTEDMGTIPHYVTGLCFELLLIE